MSKLSDPHLLLTNQYKNASNLNTRVQLHDRFSTNKYGWHRWIFDQVRCPPKRRILELGCGTGLLWAKNRDRIPAEWDLVLSDFSPGMLREAQNEMGGVHQRMDFMQIDAQSIPFKDRTFDVIIANQMLYHVPDIERALSEIHRVLRSPGILYAATGGKTDGLGIKDWVRKAQPRIDEKTEDIEWDQSFSLETGASELTPWFAAITLRRYEDSLEITEVEPLVDYVQSTIRMPLDERNVPEFRSRWSMRKLLVVVLLMASVCMCQGVDNPIMVVTPTGTVHEMVHVPVGSFQMGSNAEPQEQPVHSVFLDGFYIDKYEVTNDLYEAFVSASDGVPAFYANDSAYNAPQKPVVGVSWFDAETYCGWAGLRLPTEAEWEKAARGTDGRTYPWGEDLPTCEWAVMAEPDRGWGCGRGGAWPVGSMPTGLLSYGAHDMAGNVWEWVSDWYDAGYYATSPASNPTGPSNGLFRVLRGGAWTPSIGDLRSSFRGATGPENHSGNLGFRCAQDEAVLSTAVTPQSWGDLKKGDRR